MAHRSTERTPEFLRAWSKEHLVYEIDQLRFALKRHARLQGKGIDSVRLRNAMIESFADHVRCLEAFLWRDRSADDQHLDDSYAADFCEPATWARAREELNRPLLDDVNRRRRIGREIVHLSYLRSEVEPDLKEWQMGEILREIAEAFKAFAELAGEALSEEARDACSRLIKDAPAKGVTPPTSGATGIAHGTAVNVGNATTADHYAGGTINPRNKPDTGDR